MAGSKLNYQRAANALIYAQLHTIEAAAKKYDLSERTIKRYRNRVEDDPKLSRLVTKKQAALAEGHQQELADALDDALAFIRRGLSDSDEGMDPSDPQAIRAANGSAKILSEIAIARDVLGLDADDDEHSQPGAPQAHGAAPYAGPQARA